MSAATPSVNSIAPTIESRKSQISQDEFRWLATNFVQIKSILLDLQTRVAAIETKLVGTG